MQIHAIAFANEWEKIAHICGLYKGTAYDIIRLRAQRNSEDRYKTLEEVFKELDEIFEDKN
jgi:hypothetical protein